MGKTNEFGVILDSNGYAPSLLSASDRCLLCHRTNGKLDRHEVFGSALRDKSKKYGLWVTVCHECHLTRLHGWEYDPLHDRRAAMRRVAQRVAMDTYGWTVEEWRERFYKNYLDTED